MKLEIFHFHCRNLGAAVAGQTLPGGYDGYTSCPLVTGTKTCILAEFDFQAPPQPLETFPVNQGETTPLTVGGSW